MRATSSILTLVVVLASVLQAQTVKTIVSNGPTTNRYDIVILGDGYVAAEESKFNNNALAVANKIFATEPYRTFAKFFNVHTVFRASKESGADHPDRTPPIYKDTVYDASYNVGGTPRCLYIRNPSQALRDAALAPATEGRVLVIVNDSRYGGCAGTFSVSYNGSSMSRVQIHEFGHSFARVADEYDYPNGTYTGPEPSSKNVTKSSTGAKWSAWHGYNGVSAFEGARYYKKGLFRPKISCLMRSLGYPMCPVCQEQAVIYSYRTVSSIESPKPALATVSVSAGTKQTFSFTSLAPATSNVRITWRVDGITQSSTGTSLVVDTTGMKFGNHSVFLEVRDRTPLVRYDPSLYLRKTHLWTLVVRTPALPDLTPTFVGSTSSTAPAGSNIAIYTVVKNLGSLAASQVLVEHFISKDKIITAADTYLGHYTISSLGASQSDVNSRPKVEVPPHLTPGTYYLGTMVDRLNAIPEIYENNNVLASSLAISITRAACSPRLAYDDPLLFPTNRGSISGKKGGTLHPTVTATCNAGNGYLILMGCSGTSPGTPVPPGMTLPLNLDAWSTLALALANGPNLMRFLGTLDATGQGRATLNIPAGLFSGTLRGHFSAVLFDLKTGAFTGVTNPVGITFVP